MVALNAALAVRATKHAAILSLAVEISADTLASIRTL